MTYDTPEAPHAELKLCLAKGTHCYAALEKVDPSWHMVIHLNQQTTTANVSKLADWWSCCEDRDRPERISWAKRGRNAVWDRENFAILVNDSIWLIRICKRSLDFSYWPEIKRATSLNSPKSRTIGRYCSVSEQGQYGHGPTVAANHAYQKKVSVRFWRTTRSCWRCLQLFCSNTLKGLVDT